jgi:hypothetical protein
MAAAGEVVMLGGILLPLLLVVAVSGEPPPISRRSFPEGFIFGTASSSYQVKLPLPFQSYSSIGTELSSLLLSRTFVTSCKRLSLSLNLQI